MPILAQSTPAALAGLEQKTVFRLRCERHVGIVFQADPFIGQKCIAL
jgi:hypothetical protein